MQLYHDSLWEAREWGFLLYWQIKYEAGNIRTFEDAGPYISGGTKAPPYDKLHELWSFVGQRRKLPP